METKGLITVAVTVTVAVIVLAGILMPVLDDSTATTDTFTNDGYFKMTKYTDTDITATYDHTKPGIITVNDVEVTVPPQSSIGRNVSVIASEIFCLRYNDDEHYQFFSGNSNTYIDTGEDWSFIASAGSATFTNTTTTASRTASYESIYAISNDGDWVMKKPNVLAYMNGDSFFMGVGLTAGSSAIGIIGVNVSGDIDDGATIDVWRGSNITISDVEVVKSEVTDHMDLYLLDKISFTATNADSDSLDITYSYYIVPAKVTAERSVHLTESMNGLLAVIPILILVAVLIGVAAVVLRNRMG